MATNTVYLITGANKGIGRAIVTLLLARPSTTVIAAIRNPSDPTSASLPDLPTASGSLLHLIALNQPADFTSLSKTLSAVSIQHIDVVISNSGGSSGFKSVLDTTAEDLQYDFGANAVSALRLFQACWPLLEKRDSKKFVVMSSTMGGIGIQDQESFPGIAYGMSKAAVNWLGKKISVDFKEHGLKVGVLHPGWVKTSMGQQLADALGLKEAPTEAEESARQCLEQIDKLDMDMSGKFMAAKGKELPW